MSWNHRLLAHKDGEDYYYQIHEVYYDEKGKPNGYTERGISVGGDNLEGVNWVLDRMRECLNKPILSVDNFPKEHKESK